MNIIRTEKEERCNARRPKDLIEAMESIISNEIQLPANSHMSKKKKRTEVTKSAATERHKISKTHKQTARTKKNSKYITATYMYKCNKHYKVLN